MQHCRAGEPSKRDKAKSTFIPLLNNNTKSVERTIRRSTSDKRVIWVYTAMAASAPPVGHVAGTSARSKMFLGAPISINNYSIHAKVMGIGLLLY